MRHVVIGTAGHVDHGKTSLVKALTGVDCDRLAEERRRGITIELGFARWELAGATASVIDVPGHERFVQTMVAGAAGVDAVLLVVAADDGVMPQTREHLAICHALGATLGIVAITKCDLADDELCSLVEEEITEVARGTFLEGAPIVRCSVRDGRGLAELTASTAKIATSVRARPHDGPPWLAIDRSFVKRGFGAVVTGTLARGSIATGDALEVISGAGVARAVVRSLFVHDQTVERAFAATRLALNLRTKSGLARGAALTAEGWQRPTRVADVELHSWRTLPSPRTELVLSIGTDHVPVRARVRDGLVRLTAARPFVAYAGQRFVLRRPELCAERTIGGGSIVDPHPARRSHLPPSGDLSARVHAIVEASGGMQPADLRARLPPGCEPPIGDLIRAGDRLFTRSHVERAKRAVIAALDAFHRAHPALSGASAVELEGALPRGLRPLTSTAIASLLAEGSIMGDDRVRSTTHDARAMADRVVQLFREAGLVPGDEVIRARAGVDAAAFEDIVGELARDKKLARVASGLHVHPHALDELRARVRAHFALEETLAPGEFKALTGLTRKHAIVLLEWLDKQGVTRRRGDVRVRP